MCVGVQGVFRLLHYDFKPWHQWILPIPAAVLVRAAVYGRMSHCNLWFPVVVAQCLYLSGSSSYVVRTCLISFRRQGASHCHLNVIHSSICWNIWGWLVLETLQWTCWETHLAQDESFSAPLCCTALGDLEVLHALTFWKSKFLVQGCHWKNSTSCLKLCEAYFYFNCVLITTC